MAQSGKNTYKSFKLPLEIPNKGDIDGIEKRSAIVSDVFPEFHNQILTFKNRHQFNSYFEKLKLDETEYVALACCQHMSKLDQISDIDLVMLMMGPNFTKHTALFANDLRLSCEQQFSLLKNTWLKKIRAKLALLELVAINEEDYWISHLISISPVYFKSDTVIRFIEVNKSFMYSKENEKRKLAKKNLTSIAKSISGDSRKYKVKKYNHWLIYEKYFIISTAIAGVRKAQNKTRLNRKLWYWYKQEWKLTESEVNRILRSNDSISELTLEIIQRLGLIDDSKAFKDMQANLNLAVKNSDYAITAYQILQPFLVAFSTAPDIIMGSDIFSSFNDLDFEVKI